MSQFTHAAGRGQRRTRLAACAVLVALTALALVWIGRASAGEGGPSAPDAVLTTASNIPTGKADAVDAVNGICTVSPNFNDMPGMSETFSFGGTASRRVIVLFQSHWNLGAENSSVSIRLTIDGVVQSGPGNGFIINSQPADAQQRTVGTRGFNFISNPLAPGTHTAKIQWRDNGVGPGCAAARSLIVLHAA